MRLRQILAGLVGLAAVGLGTALFAEKPSEATYLTAAVERGDLRTTVAAVGTLNAVATVEVGSQLSGQVAELLVDFNDEVREGQPLARLDPRTFESEVREAEAALDMARAQVLTERATLQSAVSEAAATRSRLKVAEAGVERAWAQLAETERDLRRKRALAGTETLAPAHVDQATTIERSAAAGLRAAEAEAPALGARPEPDAPIEEQGGPRGASATAASRAKADPAAYEETAALLLVSRQTLDGLTPEWQSRPRPPASAVRSQVQVGGTPYRTQVSGEGSLQSPSSSPQAAPGPARHGSTAKPQVAGEVSALEDRPAQSAGGVRVFIYHVANRHGVAALAERLAYQLRRQGFTVADIRPVDFEISKPSVRYFFEDDRSASERLVEELDRFFEEETSLAPDHASDFTHYLPKPRPGNVEVWLPASPLAAALPPIATPATAAEEQLVPTWMAVDAGAHKVTMDVVAGFNPNNSNWNFNGYHDGDMTVVVPEGWQVEITLTHRDGAVPHSLVVMADPGTDNLPLQAGREQAAFPRAYSRSPEQGISARDQDTISFKADQTGEFLWFCGVPGHGQSGMWMRFAVIDEAETPYITITADAEPGRV